ncbi:MAG: cation diffusion facilitator family transporter [Lactobacillaceae bacterium]|jgi:ferrous-iron efflux pump FieF|nr:cation diffusion facilitator family transporter [Lactobacillaceae bacterium]
MLLDSTQKNNGRTLKKIASFLSVSLAVFLSVIKFLASISTGSLSILSSMIDSIADVLASAITFIAIRYSTKPASRDFRYGYGKIEALSSFLQALFITGSGLFILYDGISRFFKPKELDDSFLGITIMLISLTLTISLVAFQKYVVRKTNSLALRGDSLHYITDIGTNMSVIIALIIIKITGITWIDSVVAIGIAAYLIHTAYILARDAVCMLMDQELGDDIKEDVEKIILSEPYVKGMHDLRTRSLGENDLFEFHLELDPNISLVAAHNHAHQVEAKIHQKYPDAQVIIHQEPEGAKEFHLDKQIELSKER